MDALAVGRLLDPALCKTKKYSVIFVHVRRERIHDLTAENISSGLFVGVQLLVGGSLSSTLRKDLAES